MAVPFSVLIYVTYSIRTYLFVWKRFSVIFVFLINRAVVNLPETLGTHFSLKITALREYLSISISSGLIIMWKCRKVLNTGSYKFSCGRKYCFWTMLNTKILCGDWGEKNVNCVYGIAQCLSNKKALIIHNYSCQLLKKMQFLVFFLTAIKKIIMKQEMIK